MRKFKKVFAIVLIAVICFTAASCSSFENTTISENGSVEVVSKLVASEPELKKAKSFAVLADDAMEDEDSKDIKTLRLVLKAYLGDELIGNTAVETLENFKKVSTVSVVNDINYYTYEYKKSFKNTDSYNNTVFRKTEGSYSTGKLTTTDYWSFIDGAASINRDFALSSIYGFEMEMETTFKMPYKVTKTNGTKVDDYTVKYDSYKDVSYIITEKSTAAWTKAKSPKNALIDSIKKDIKPAKVTNLSVTYKSSDTILIKWKALKNVSYEVQRKVKGGKWKTIESDTYGDNYIYDYYGYSSEYKSYYGDLSINKKYYYRVRAFVETESFNVYGNYSSAKGITAIDFKAPSLKVKSSKKAVTLNVKKKCKYLSGYEIKYSTNKSLKGAKVKRVKSLPKKITKLKSGKKYYFKARKYKVVNGKRIYGSYSKLVSAKVK